MQGHTLIELGNFGVLYQTLTLCCVSEWVTVVKQITYTTVGTFVLCVVCWCVSG